MTIEEYKSKRKFKIPKFINKFLLIVTMFLITIISLKSNQQIRTSFYENIYNTNISFASINSLYQKYFGSPIPNIFNNTKTVFNEELKYTSKNDYLDGVELKVEGNYLVPALDNGIVIFIGEKEGYNNTIIIECENGIELWYGNIQNENVKMYDYISKGTLLGEANNSLYLVFMMRGEVVDYEAYI